MNRDGAHRGRHPVYGEVGVLATFALSALWLGGLTFYAAVVVPIGTEAIGATEQGFITQQVTHWLNALGALSIGAWILECALSGGRRLLITAATAAALQIALFALHPILDSGLDVQSRIVFDEDAFYGYHRLYLLATAGLWAVGVLHCGLLLRRYLRGERGAPPPSEDSKDPPSSRD